MSKGHTYSGALFLPENKKETPLCVPGALEDHKALEEVLKDVAIALVKGRKHRALSNGTQQLFMR